MLAGAGAVAVLAGAMLPGAPATVAAMVLSAAAIANAANLSYETKLAIRSSSKGRILTAGHGRCLCAG